MVQVPSLVQGEGRGVDLLKWERNGAITLLNQSDLGKPVGSKYLSIEAVDDRIDLRADGLQLVPPAGEDASGTDHPTHLGIETVVIESVQCRRNRHEIDGGVTQRRPLGGSDEVAELRVGMSLGDLLRAGVCGDDGVEMGRNAS